MIILSKKKKAPTLQKRQHGRKDTLIGYIFWKNA
nr:MAG TPA: hypothetical protein [Caudoviricetes sp.]